MTSTYVTAAFNGSTINDACTPKIHFPSLLPISDNLHDWINQFKIKESNSAISDETIGISNNALPSNERYVSPSCSKLPCNSSEDDDALTNFSFKAFYGNQIPYFRSQFQSTYVLPQRPIQVGFPNHRVVPKFDERKFQDFYINPIELNFLPKELWLTQKVTLKSVFQTFFKARSTKNLRFEHKLWNALSLSKHYPELIPFLGVFWVSKNLIKVNRDIFGALINVSKPAAALFNNQGSFLTHGFLEISKEKALKKGIPPELIDDVDESVVRLFKHSAGLLTADSNKADVSTCRWNK